jgi:hypothetical protein
MALPAAAQPQQIQGGAPTEAWDSERVLALVAQARSARARLVADGALRSYEALTQGHVYFFVDPEVGERALIRVDQVAVELRWQAPDRLQQHIVGERSETRLPVQDFRYYLDRLTVVQHGLGDEIQVGSGMDVAGVPHPFAPVPPGADAPYEYRLADSLSLVLPGREEPLRLYEVDVRPTDPSAPGILGSVTVERGTAEIVRMAITFTPASYVDRRTDRISVELDYGLWEGRYWLPNLQHIEVRREIPELDLAVGTVIRAVLRTGDYRLNVPLPDDFSVRPAITAEPEARRAEFDFREGLFDRLARDGLAEIVLEADPQELQAKAAELMRSQASSGLAPLRLHLSGLSSALRYSRAEGLVLGLGASLRLAVPVTVRGHVGTRTGPGTVHGTLSLDLPVTSRASVAMLASVAALRDLGLAPGSAPLVSSLGAVLRGEDYRDPYFATGVGTRLEVERAPGARVSLGLALDRIESAVLSEKRAPLDADRTFRPIRPVAEGTFFGSEVGLHRSTEWPGGGRGWLDIEAAVLTGRMGRGASVALESDASWGPPSGQRELALRIRAWGWRGDPLPQGHRLLGGRGTLPGYRFRRFAGTAVAAATLEASTDLGHTAIRLRAAVHAGWSGRADPEVLRGWEAEETRGLRSSFSLGAGFLWDILRIDATRGHL